jgi:hypothetical protein
MRLNIALWRCHDVGSLRMERTDNVQSASCCPSVEYGGRIELLIPFPDIKNAAFVRS